jgi:DNA-binding LytR/AlgR family response regulator
MQLNNDLHLLIVEDNPGFAQLLQMMLEELGVVHIQWAQTYDEAWAFFQKRPPDIGIIDIDLGEGEKNGIVLVEKMRETAAQLPIVYLTANYNEACYLSCRHTRPSSFMNKEISRLKLHQAIELALRQLKSGETVSKTIPAPGPAPAPMPAPFLTNTHFFFKVGDIYKNIAVEDIAFFYAQGKMTFAKVEKRNFPTNVQLKTLEEELFPKFIRIHKSYLVNVAHIESINTKDDKVEVAGESLPIGYSHRKTFFEQLKLLK